MARLSTTLDRRIAPRRTLRLLMPLALLLPSACYLTQAAVGHLELQARAEPIERLLRRGVVPPRLAELLGQVGEIKAFATTIGLVATEHYQSYAELDRDAAVWVVTASAPLRFHLKTWDFPLVGSFPYLGFFDRGRADRFAETLADEGWDVYVRGSSAYSTLGWFSDPLLSTMLGRGAATVGDFVNTVLHESVHATLHLDSQAYFNESVALFVADAVTPTYLVRRYGPTSTEVVGYLRAEQRRAERGRTIQRTYVALRALYDSPLDDQAKLHEKDGLLTALQAELGSPTRPNNAMLEGYRTYRIGQASLAGLLAACDGDWPRFFAALRRVDADQFPAPHHDDLDPILDALSRRGCPASPTATPSRP